MEDEYRGFRFRNQTELYSRAEMPETLEYDQKE